ncbi:MAG: HD domain-containing protein [Gemmatimonadota bacterium]
MTPSDAGRTVRDPLWQNIRLGAAAAAIVDTPQFQRLRRVKQLGFAHLVYPGAIHTRFLHALGVYHLTGRAVEALDSRGALAALDAEQAAEVPVVRLAALLHDVGHYPFSHAMEELEAAAIPGHHEEMAGRFLAAPGIRRVLAGVAPDAAERVNDLIRGRSDHPLQGLVSGSLDLDKIDYLRRDSMFCGVPYGAVDVDRLLESLTLAREGPGAPLEVAVTEKGISALESLLFAKYQMFRNVYWHHAVRAATVAFRRLIEGALGAGLLAREELAGPTDEELLTTLAARMEARDGKEPVLGTFLDGLTHRRLPKRALELYGDELPTDLAEWIPGRRDLVRRVEDRLAADLGRRPGEVMVDYPANPRMLDLRLLLVRRRGEVQRLTSSGEEGLIDLPRIGRALHHTTRVLRVFTPDRPDRPLDPEPLLTLFRMSEEEAEERLADGEPLAGP